MVLPFHGAYWHNDFGVPHSHGCINMTPGDGKVALSLDNPRRAP